MSNDTSAADTGLVERTWEQEKAAFNDWANYGEHDPINACVPVEAAKMAWLARAGREAAAHETIRAMREAVEHIRNNMQVVQETLMDPVLGPTYIIHGITLNRLDAALTLARETNDGQ